MKHKGSKAGSESRVLFVGKLVSVSSLQCNCLLKKNLAMCRLLGVAMFRHFCRFWNFGNPS